VQNRNFLSLYYSLQLFPDGASSDPPSIIKRRIFKLEVVMNTHESWDELYRLAIYESDVKRLPDRITNARHAILARIEELHESGEGGGEERLKVALEILEDLSDAALRTRVLTKHRMDSDWRSASLSLHWFGTFRRRLKADPADPLGSTN